MSHKLVCLIRCLMTFTLIVGCSNPHQQRQSHFQQWMQDNGKVKVLSTTAMIDDLVKQVGGDYVDTMTLIQGNLDPHSYQLVKGDDEKLTFAHLIFYNGLGLEHGHHLQSYLVSQPKTIALGDQIGSQDPSLIITVQNQKDPHIWMDISIWRRAVPFIVEALSQYDPAHAAVYRANGEQLQIAMDHAHEQAKEIMHRVPENRRYLITSHDAFNYFARAYLSGEGEVESGEWQKRFAAPEGLAPESQLSTVNIKAIIDYLQHHQVHLLFPESNVNRDSLKKVVEAGQKQGLEVSLACCPLYGDAMGQPGSEADSYLKMILYNARILSEHMNHVKIHATDPS